MYAAAICWNLSSSELAKIDIGKIDNDTAAVTETVIAFMS
jgi:hypothetical protein